MGMIHAFYRAKKETIEKLSRITEFEELEEVFDEVVESMDIGKSWQMIMYLLTGDKYGGKDSLVKNLFYPPHYTITITDEGYEYHTKGVDDERKKEIWKKIDLNNGYLLPEEVMKIYDHLQHFSIGDLFDNCSNEAIRDANIYPGYWDISPYHRNKILNNFNELLAFLSRAVKAKHYVISELE